MSHYGRISKLIALAAVTGLACSGQIGQRSPDDCTSTGTPGMTGKGDHPGTHPPGGGQAGGGSTGETGTGTVTPGEPGVAVFRRLTRLEYNNTVRDLLGDASNPANSFPPDNQSAESGYVAGGPVADADASHLLDAAEALSQTAQGKLATLLPCGAPPAASADQDKCANDFITQFGKRAFRRPLTADEAADLTALYSGERASGTDFPNAMRVLIAAFLMSPQFLYRWEVTPDTVVRDGAMVRYNSYEMASRLSYLFWASMPDKDGFAAADADKLSTPAGIEAEARRLLKDGKAKQAISDFATQWLGVADLRSAPKDPKAFPAFTPALADSMAAETATFAASVLIDGDGSLKSLFTSSKSFVDANLATLYGMTGVTSTTPVPMMLNAAQRAGILTQASFLTQQANPDETNPPRRGKVIADRVICADIAPPPDNVPDPKPPMMGVSQRQRFADHSTNPCAKSCHGVLDPIGFAFENYNGIGAWQTMDRGQAIDASGSVELDGAEKTFKNAIEMQSFFADSPMVAECMAKQLLQYALRRAAELGDKGGDTASVAAAKDALVTHNYDLRELLVALTTTRSFTHRTPANGEVLP